jgi:hypothetical protein
VGGMSILNASVMGWFSAAALLSGCVSSSVVKPPDAPERLRPPANQVLAFETLATGVQIYECEARRDQPALFEWAFRAPQPSSSTVQVERWASTTRVQPGNRLTEVQ